MEIQYVLTEQEYQDAVRAKREALEKAKGKLFKFCQEMAESVPVSYQRYDGTMSDPAPAGCISTQGGKNENGYCSDCPVSRICPKEWKNWSQ